MDGFKNTTKTQYSMGGSCAGPRGAAAMSKASKAFRSGGMVEGISSRPKPIPGGDPAVRAAVARGNQSKFGQPEVEHGPRRLADILAKLRPDQHDGRLISAWQHPAPHWQSLRNPWPRRNRDRPTA